MRKRSASLFQPCLKSTAQNKDVLSDSSDEDEEHIFSKMEDETSDDELDGNEDNTSYQQPNELMDPDGCNFRQDDLELLDYINKLVMPNDSLIYRSRINKINWKQVGQRFKKPPEELKLKLKNIIKDSKLYRTLPSIINDAKHYIQRAKIKYIEGKNHHPDMPPKPLKAFVLYLQEVRDQKIPREEKWENYKKMSVAERSNLYKKAEDLMKTYKQQLEEYYENHPERKPKKLRIRSITPYSLYRQAMLDNNIMPSLEKWNDLPVENKIMYINRAIAIKDLGDKKCTIPRKELEVFNTFYNKPDQPGLDRYQTYVKENISSKSIEQVKHDWQSLSEIEKEEYTTKTIKNLAKYLTQFEEYINRLPDEDQPREIANRDKLQEKYVQFTKRGKRKQSVKCTMRSSITKHPIKKGDEFISKKRRVSGDGENVQLEIKQINDQSSSEKKISDSETSFKIKKPPRTFYKYWTETYCIGKSKNSCKTEYNKLDKTKKKTFKKIYADEIQNYISSLKIYLKSLSATEMQQYLDVLKAEEAENSDGSEESSSDDE